jgi:hypothetical protein
MVRVPRTRTTWFQVSFADIVSTLYPQVHDASNSSTQFPYFSTQITAL